MAEPRAAKRTKTAGMGRGLAAILSESKTAPLAAGELRELPITQVKANPGQPRKRFDPEALAALVESVKASGIIQPLLVRPLATGGFEVIAGERRLRAAHEAGLERVPAIVRDPDEIERLQQALIENVVREDLNPVEEARACDALVRDLGLSKQELARHIGRSRPALSNLIRLLDLPDEVLARLETGEISEGHGRAILAIEDHEAQKRLAAAAASEGWSVRRTEQEVKRRQAPTPSRSASRSGLSAEEQEAIERASQSLERALGHEVKVRLRGDELAAELRFSDLEEVLELAARLSPARRR